MGWELHLTTPNGRSWVVPLRGEGLTLGRAASNDIVLFDAEMPEHWLRLRRENGRYDLFSGVDGEKCRERARAQIAGFAVVLRRRRWLPLFLVPVSWVLISLAWGDGPRAPLEPALPVLPARGRFAPNAAGRVEFAVPARPGAEGGILHFSLEGTPGEIRVAWAGARLVRIPAVPEVWGAEFQAYVPGGGLPGVAPSLVFTGPTNGTWQVRDAYLTDARPEDGRFLAPEASLAAAEKLMGQEDLYPDARLRARAFLWRAWSSVEGDAAQESRVEALLAREAGAGED